MIDQQYAHLAIDYLKQNHNVIFENGLSDPEVETIERSYGFTFPPDLRLLLQTALPVSDDFPNWRADPYTPIIKSIAHFTLMDRFNWPYEGIRFDIEHANYWKGEWGKRPSSLEKAFEVAREHISQVPTLIPIFAHRYIPDDPLLPDNPVFSVYQTDIIYYGSDLPSYLAAEFEVPNPYPAVEPRKIKFWSDFC
jgi:hypothetical protein